MKNNFAELLHKLVHETGIKMINISMATGYDLSYVSKWVSGKMLPSEKCIDLISDQIAKCICSLGDMQLEPLIRSFGCEDKDAFQRTIYEALLQAYYQSKDIAKNKSMELFGRISIGDILRQNTAVNDAVAIVDLFSLDRDSRLEFAGIRNGRHNSQEEKPPAEITIVVCVDNVEDEVYDCLYLLHLISIYSKGRLSIYNSSVANGKVLYVVDQHISVSGVIFPKDKVCTAVSVIDDLIATKQLLQVYTQHINRANMVMRAISLNEFVQSKSYIKSMLSESNRWLIGHITELLLPNELFDELLNQIDGYEPTEYKAIYDFAQGIIKTGKTRILFYETMISDLLATGEVDFFNHKLHFNRYQINQFLEYLMELNASTINFRLIKTGFSTHFEHLYNPCLFISDSNVFMRLENAYERDSVLIYVDPKVKKLIGRFYDAAWDKRPDVVEKNTEKIKEVLTHYQAMNSLLTRESIESENIDAT